jgi:hypothetical protein
MINQPFPIKVMTFRDYEILFIKKDNLLFSHLGFIQKKRLVRQT